eukprot:2702746-Pleurochrysis_carterae.AAC.8
MTTTQRTLLRVKHSRKIAQSGNEADASSRMELAHAGQLLTDNSEAQGMPSLSLQAVQPRQHTKLTSVCAVRSKITLLVKAKMQIWATHIAYFQVESDAEKDICIFAAAQDRGGTKNTKGIASAIRYPSSMHARLVSILLPCIHILRPGVPQLIHDGTMASIGWQ